MDQTAVAVNSLEIKLEGKSGKVQNSMTEWCRKWFPAAESDEMEINTTKELASVLKEVKAWDVFRVKGYTDKHASTNVTD
jgi:metal-dependent amidase/aminoacylase/carboxypeptidase family protein